MKRAAVIVMVALSACSLLAQDAGRSSDDVNAPPVDETITVTASRGEARLSDTPASVVVLGRKAIDISPGATIDDVLRQVPGFTLFRRTGSRIANPTAQGVSLRGVGASGASRALVLDDGIPLNDAFGGWVYWGRVPRAALERVEVQRGGASDLYGSGATGGVIQFVRDRSDTRRLSAEVSGGSDATVSASLFAAEKFGPVSVALAVSRFTTGGYIPVERSQRGAVDRAADTDQDSVDATVRHGAAFLRASYYGEARNNGTTIQVNNTIVRQLAGGGELPAAGGLLTLRSYVTSQDYFQTFSAIASDRASERLTVEQRVPSDSAGGTLQWARLFGQSHALVSGAEVRDVSGTSDEVQFALSGTRTRVASKGRQRTWAAFAEDIYAASPRMSVTAGVRFDAWSNLAASRNGTPLPRHDESSWSPRLAAIYKLADRASITASAYRAFRAPTLNELYRGFRVGNVVTQANESLRAETLAGYEAGVRYRDLRATIFRMDTDDAIANVTLSSTPSLITRQRRNATQSRSQGLEIEGERRTGRWLFSTGYLLTGARIRGGSLDGRRLPQVARHQLTAQVTWSGPMTAAVFGRWSSSQFDDDLNTLPLRSFVVFDAFASRPLARGLDLTFVAENMFDRRIEASATPVITLATPRALRVGLVYRK